MADDCATVAIETVLIEETRPTVFGEDQAVVRKWTVPVDDQVHEMPWPADAQVVHVAPLGGWDAVLVWTIGSAERERPRRVRVFSTGQPIPTPCTHLGTAVTPHGLVWHLVELLTWTTADDGEGDR